MKLEEIDNSLLEFDLGTAIKGINLLKNIGKLKSGQLEKDAIDWIFNKKIPNELEKYGERRREEKRRQQTDRKRKVESVAETATTGATSAGNIATVTSVPGAYRKIKKGKNGLPKAPQATNPNGTAKNAIDTDINLMGGVIKR